MKQTLRLTHQEYVSTLLMLANAWEYEASDLHTHVMAIIGRWIAYQ